MSTCSLTFDDGPDEVWTARVLDRLASEGAPSTFFVMADRARRCAGLIDRMRAEGHEVAFHCVDHVRHSELEEQELRDDTLDGLRTLAQLGATIRRWRAPWGVVTEATRRIAAEHQLELVGWSADTQDYNGDGAALMHSRVAGGVRAGAVVLLHDGIGPGAQRCDCRETVELIPRLVETMRGRGLRPAALPETGA